MAIVYSEKCSQCKDIGNGISNYRYKTMNGNNSAG